jgi:hypothetical protein
MYFENHSLVHFVGRLLRIISKNGFKSLQPPKEGLINYELEFQYTASYSPKVWLTKRVGKSAALCTGSIQTAVLSGFEFSLLPRIPTCQFPKKGVWRLPRDMDESRNNMICCVVLLFYRSHPLSDLATSFGHLNVLHGCE